MKQTNERIFCCDKCKTHFITAAATSKNGALVKPYLCAVCHHFLTPHKEGNEHERKCGTEWINCTDKNCCPTGQEHSNSSCVSGKKRKRIEDGSREKKKSIRKTAR